jgi:hypothetical protein
MPFTAEDLAQLGAFIDQKISQAAPAAPASAPEADRASIVGVPEVDPEAGPEYYIHLADGEVLKSHDSSSTHLPSPEDGTTQLVIGRYTVGA